MAGRMWSVLWAFWRGWLFGVVLGLVLGAGLGTFFIPVVGTVYGVAIGVPLGAVTGLAAAVLIAPVALLRPSILGDRVWPGVVSAALALLVSGKVVFRGLDSGNLFDVGVVGGVAAVAGVLSACFGPAMIRRVRIRFLHAPSVGALGAAIGGLVAAGRVAVEGWPEPAVIIGFTFGGIVTGGILGLTLVAFNLLVTKEPAAE
ncbi:MAG: hypothetical protein ACRDPS_18640 [Nocardioides sp.]|uniref:hypothetical protein n=1 Tax=Nocardioides sp. TaxID=35761 RepID=UPI003D6A6E42